MWFSEKIDQNAIEKDQCQLLQNSWQVELWLGLMWFPQKIAMIYKSLRMSPFLLEISQFSYEQVSGVSNSHISNQNNFYESKIFLSEEFCTTMTQRFNWPTENNIEIRATSRHVTPCGLAQNEIALVTVPKLC